MKRMLIVALVGIILGFAASKVQFLQWLTIIPWGIVALVIGWFARTKKDALIQGAVYGFFLGFVFMFGVYEGSAPVVTRIPFFAVLGLASAVCAIILSFLGSIIKKLK